MKIKLVAIAKDEAAYLAEWIFHHLYFGFDEIDIYINFTTDHSEQLINKVSQKYPVNLHDVEDLIPPDSLPSDQFLSKSFLDYNKLQARAYSDAVEKTLEAGDYSHIMFLDIDEFWTPVCFKKKIKDVLRDLSLPDTASFYWKNKVSEDSMFQRPFQNEVFYLDNPHYKSILTVSPDIIIMNTHRSLHKTAIKRLKDRYNEQSLNDNNKFAFILHRFQRYEDEYISMLGRGDPTSPYEFSLKFNRSGFQRPENPLSIYFNKHLIESYNKKYHQFVLNAGLDVYIESGRNFVIDRKIMVLDYINKNLNICETIKKVLPGTTILKSFSKNKI